VDGAVVYCRVSTKDQVQNLSLSTQRVQCERYCRERGWDVLRVFVEEGESAKTTDRTQFLKLLTYCGENRKRVQYVVVYALSRFARNHADHSAVRAVLHEYGISLRSVTEQIDDSAAGQLMENILASFSQFDNDARSERTVAGMKAAIQKGRWVHVPPVGYMKPPNGARDPSLIPDPDRAPLVRLAFELVASGRFSPADVRRQVTAAGLRSRRNKTLPPQTFHALLRNPLYAGRIKSRWGIEAPGDFEAIVPEALFEATQAVLEGRRPSVPERQMIHPDFPLRVFVRCARCDKPLTGSWSKGRASSYAYYRCRTSGCATGSTAKESLEEAFERLLVALQPRKEYLALFRAIVLDVWQDRQADAARLRASLEENLSKLKDKKTRLDESFIFRGEIARDTYVALDAKVREEILVAQIELSEATIEELDVEAVLGFAEHLMGNAAALWKALPANRKRVLQDSIFPEGVTFDGEAFGTAVTCGAFTYLRLLETQEDGVASPTGLEPLAALAVALRYPPSICLTR
jgi:DNA invertase Pin-like site-specific DNA recombinase